MPIKSIKVSNFKSFKELDVTLGNLNILIGPNASGKSNFLQIFRFLRDITNHGLKNAISLQGGVEYLRNAVIGSSNNLSVEVIYLLQPDRQTWDVPVLINGKRQEKLIARYFYESTYTFILELSSEGSEFKVIEDKLTRKVKFCQPKNLQTPESKDTEEVGSGVMIFSNIEGELKYEFIPETVPVELKDTILEIFSGKGFANLTEKIPPKTLLMETSLFDIINPFENLFRYIPIYDFDPKLSKKAIPLTGRMDLEEDGNNLAIVLKNIIENEEKKRKFVNLINYLLPFVTDMQVEQFVDKFFIFSLQENYTQNLHLPASFLSDGTVNIIALITALYFTEAPFIIIEEPERNIHPFLIAKIVQVLEEVAIQKQILVTTHNPETVKYSQLGNILLVTRNKAGFSTISRPGEKEEVRVFLENEIGLKDLYIQDLLGL